MLWQAADRSAPISFPKRNARQNIVSKAETTASCDRVMAEAEEKKTIPGANDANPILFLPYEKLYYTFCH